MCVDLIIEGCLSVFSIVACGGFVIGLCVGKFGVFGTLLIKKARLVLVGVLFCS